MTRRGEAAARDEGVAGSGLYEAIVESVDLALALVDESLRIVWVNRRFDEAFASSRSSCVGGRLVKIIRNDRLESVVRRALTDREPVREEELNLRTGDGEERQFLLAVSKVEPGLSTESCLLALNEITRWRRRQFQVMEAGRLTSIGEIAAGIAHEINNPMAAIMGFSQLILRRDLDETVRRDQERILHEATRAAKIISDLQSFARGHMPRREHVDVVKVIRRVLEFRAYSFQVDNIRTVTRFWADAALTLGDEHRLDQLFLNLVVNAQQFMRDAHGSGTLSVDLSKSPEWISVSVTDDGPGIATDDLPKVFDRFFTTKEVGKGTGLGLSMCYGIVREHGGTIAAHSGPGKGATFTVQLPSVYPGENRTISETAEPDAHGRGF